MVIEAFVACRTSHHNLQKFTLSVRRNVIFVLLLNANELNDLLIITCSSLLAPVDAQ